MFHVAILLHYKGFIINSTSILKIPAWAAGLGIAIAFSMASSASAQSDGLQQSNSSSRQESGKTGQSNSQSRSDGSCAMQEAQPSSLSGDSYADQTLASCEEVAPVREGFLKKLLRILSGPDTPRGPNTDVDTNISAGGAGGG